MFNSAVVFLSALASETAEEGEVAHVSPYWYGAVTLIVLLLLLFLVTRLNIDRWRWVGRAAGSACWEEPSTRSIWGIWWLPARSGTGSRSMN